MKVAAFKAHWLTTIFGDIRIKRRLYRDKDGNCRFLLDEKMGLDKGSHVSPRMKQLAVLTSTHHTFREVEESIKAIFPWSISHTTIHNLSSKVAELYIAEYTVKSCLMQRRDRPNDLGAPTPIIVPIYT